jgi:hypothetical protein
MRCGSRRVCWLRHFLFVDRPRYSMAGMGGTSRIRTPQRVTRRKPYYPSRIRGRVDPRPRFLRQSCAAFLRHTYPGERASGHQAPRASADDAAASNFLIPSSNVGAAAGFATKEASLIGGSLVLGFTVVWRLLQGAMRYTVQRRSLETVITELAGVKTRAKEDAAIQRAQAEQLKSLEVELTRVRAEAAEAREEAARQRARRTS